MNRTFWLGLAAVVLLLVGGTVFFWRQSAKPASPTDSAQGLPGAVAPEAADEDGQQMGMQDNGFGEHIPVQPTEDKTQLARLYQLPYIKEYYEGEYEGYGPEASNRAPQPAFDYQQSLTGKSYLDLLLLRNTVYARNGYCFLNATARQYFAREKWYRPLWLESSTGQDGMASEASPDSVIRVPLNAQEMAFVRRVQAREAELLKQRVANQGGYPMLGVNFVTNQSDLTLTPAMRTVLGRHNFVFVPTKEEQLFYLYDQNQYDYTPNFITTDLILQLLHKYLNGILSDVEETRLIPVVGTMLRQGRTEAQRLAQQSQTPAARNAAEWAAAYYAVGEALLTGGSPIVTGAYADDAQLEVARCTAAAGRGSVLLIDSLFDYSVCKPRGMYTRTDTTRRYFRAVKWLNSGPVFLDSDAGVLRAVALAQALAARPAGSQNFANFTRVLSVLVGEEDNRSLTQLLAQLQKNYSGQSLDALATPATLARIRQVLVASGTDRIRPQAATVEADAAVARPTMLFTAGRYTFDAEILARLVNVRRPGPNKQPPRPFPKGLDVFAVFGNATAQRILLDDYREAARWPAYPDTLRQLQRQFRGFKNWDQNLYTKTMQALLALNAPDPAGTTLPYFARTPAWQKRNLSTALGGWAELKHDLLLYTEQPMGAEAGGGGGGPPPPIHLSYVEPNLPFWDAALALLAHQDRSLTRLRANTPHLSELNKELQELITRLRNVARQELSQPMQVPKQMGELSWIGGEVERLTLKILKTDPLPDREKNLALVADVYSFDGKVLEEAVGTADALYVIVEIGGVPVLARGATFSYYEFISRNRLTDEEWQQQLTREAPARPSWMQELIVPVKELAKARGKMSE